MAFTMMIRFASATAIAALMSTTAMAQSPNAPMAQPAPRGTDDSICSETDGSARAPHDGRAGERYDSD